mmetsp:Transcript_15533/g.20217  ORF Transcript_15533/g.20217 Transcript_15533/m.20217 type:complete len:89 (-) Transcript_15533:256-522(-)
MVLNFAVLSCCMISMPSNVNSAVVNPFVADMISIWWSRFAAVLCDGMAKKYTGSDVHNLSSIILFVVVVVGVVMAVSPGEVSAMVGLS